MLDRFLRFVRASSAPPIEVGTVIKGNPGPAAAFLVEVHDWPGGLVRVLSGLGERVERVMASRRHRGDGGYLLVVAGGCDASCAEEVSGELRAHAGKIEHAVAGARPVILRAGLPHIGGERALVVPLPGLAYAGRELERTAVDRRVAARSFGRGVGAAVYDAWFNRWFDAVNPDELVQSAASTVAGLLHALGFGDARVAKADPFEIVLEVEESAECLAAKAAGWPGPAGAMTTGVIEGFLEKALARRVSVSEEKCVANGDGRCVFRIRVLDSATYA